MPFQHDEFSAIFRLNFQSLGALLNEGVALRDSHPAGVQVFLYYWTRLSGLDHFWMRLPFVLAGTFSIWLTYRAGKKLFGEPVGLLAAAAMAVMQYFVYYSQMARPYIPGVFFNLLAFNILLDIRSNNIPKLGLRHMGLALSLSLAAWVHHFSAMEAGLIYLSGLIMLKPQHYKHMAVVAILAIVFYLPCVGITLTQMRAGGIGGWLGKPDVGFIPNFFFYTANFSFYFGAVLLIPWFVGLFASDSNRPIWFHRLLLLMLFVIPLALGWLYSVMRVPVLQFSTLIFGFPFFLLAFFSFGTALPRGMVVAGVVLVLLTGTTSLLTGRQHIKVMQQQAFYQAPHIAKSHARLHGNAYTFVAVSSTPEMFSFYRPHDEHIKHRFFNRREPLGLFSQMLDTLQAEYLGLAWADYVPYEWIATARSRYGLVLEHHSWFNAEYYLLRKSEAPALVPEKERLLLHQFFAPPVEVKGQEYALLFESDTLFRTDDDVVAVNLRCLAADTVESARLIVEFRVHPDSMPSVWMAGQLSRKILPGQTFSLHTAWRFDSGEPTLRKALFRTYIWNPDRENFTVHERWAWAASYDKMLFGLFKPL